MKSYEIKSNHAGNYFRAESENGLVGSISLMHIDTLFKVLKLENSKYYKSFLRFIMNMTKKCAYETRSGLRDYKLVKLYDMKAKGIIFENGWYINFPEMIDELSTIMGFYYGGVHFSQRDRDYVVKRTEEILTKYKEIKKESKELKKK